jgi:serine/threonine-protein kinase RsbW
MAELPANVRLSLAATAENVVLVREMLAGIADGVGLDAPHLHDIQTAVTEACNNVVLHAYDGEQGPLDVEVRLQERTFAVRVLDRGIGMGIQEDGQEAGGIGLHVMRTLARAVEFDLPSRGGTSVCMEFHAPQAASLDPDWKGGDPQQLELSESPSTTTVNIAPIALARTVLPRLVTALAARAHFTTDRISDVQLLADALVAHAHAAVHGDRLDIDVDVEPRALELHVAPIATGRSRGLVGESELDGLGRIIEKLSDRRRVRTVDGYETLSLSLEDRR